MYDFNRSSYATGGNRILSINFTYIISPQVVYSSVSEWGNWLLTFSSLFFFPSPSLPPWYRGGKFISVGEKIRLPDDVTMGYIIGELALSFFYVLYFFSLAYMCCCLDIMWSFLAGLLCCLSLCVIISFPRYFLCSVLVFFYFFFLLFSVLSFVLPDSLLFLLSFLALVSFFYLLFLAV